MAGLKLGDHVGGEKSGSIANHTRSLTLAMTLSVAALTGCSSIENIKIPESNTLGNTTKEPSIAQTKNGVNREMENIKSEEELLAELLTTQINFNGKEKPMSPLIKLVKSETPGNYYIEHPDIKKVTLASLEVNSRGELITKKFLITIDGLDFFTYAYAKQAYGILNGDICIVKEGRNEGMKSEGRYSM